MYEYKVVRIPTNPWSGKPKEDYLTVINDYAAEGWRFIQIVPENLKYTGKKAIELIFEKHLA